MTKVLLVAVHHRQSDFEDSILETIQLIEACDYEWVLTVTQNSSDESPTYVKSGKIDEIIEHIANQEVDLMVTNDELSPSQHRNLEEILGIDVMDRTQLILNIFEKRAQSKEAKLQVEVATLSYLLPRTNLQLHTVSRQRGGGARNKGSGEKALALSKRVTEKQLMKAEVALKIMETQRLTQRQKRHKNNLFTVALVGYTNAGKSTLMNQLMKMTDQNDKLVSEKNRLFETLQTATRIIET
ncbi:MAG: GTPase HflX, partial [Erysipelotrichaceae bacterium]